MSKRFFAFLFAFAAVAGGVFYFSGRGKIDADKIIADSLLGGRSFSLPVVEVVSPKYGLKAYLLEDKSNPIVSLSFMFAGAGRGAEGKGQEGLAGMTAAMIAEAAGGLDAEEFKEKLAEHAIALGYDAGADDFSGHLLTTREFAPVAYEMLRQTLSSPELAEKDLRRIKKQMLALLASQTESPEQKLSLLMGQKLFGDHLYGRNPLGKKEDIESFSSCDIRDFAAKNFGRSNLIAGIAGDISPAEAGKLLDDVFGVLPAAGANDRVPEIVPDIAGGFVHQNDNLPQTVSFAAAVGTKRLAADFYPLYIANYILGGAGLNSRLHQAAREKEGLTYGVYTGLSLPAKTAMIVGNFSTTPQNYARMEEVFVAEWNRMGRFGATADELAEAKNYLLNSYNLRFADITNISAMLVYMQRENLGLDFLQKRNDYVREVTLEQVNRAAAKYFTPDNLRLISLGNFNQSWGENNGK